MAADIEVHMVAHMEVDKVADMAKLRVPNLARRRRKGTQFGERVGHGGWLIGPKLFRPQAYPTYASSLRVNYIHCYIQVGRDGAMQILAEELAQRYKWKEAVFPTMMEERGFPREKSDGLKGFHYR